MAGGSESVVIPSLLAPFLSAATRARWPCSDLVTRPGKTGHFMTVFLLGDPMAQCGVVEYDIIYAQCGLVL